VWCLVEVRLSVILSILPHYIRAALPGLESGNLLMRHQVRVGVKRQETRREGDRFLTVIVRELGAASWWEPVGSDRDPMPP
jgi:hypothetical protein